MPTISYNLAQTVSPTLVNDYAPGNENSPTLVASLDGSHYLSAWVTPLASDAVLGRLEAANGQPAGAEFTLNSTQTNNQNDVNLAVLQNGGYVAAFTDYSTGNGDIRVRMFGADGHALAPDFLADNDPNYQFVDDSQADVAVLTSGKIVVTSTANWGAGDSDIHYLMYDQNGTQLQPRYAVNDALDATSNSSIAALTGGGFIVAYQANTGGNNRVEFTRFDDNGTILGGNDLGGTDIDHIGNNTDIQAVGLSDGGFVVAYTDTGWNISGSEITARIYNADGTARSNYIFVNQDGITNGNQDHASLTALSNGDFAISWKSGTDEYIRAFDSTGTALTGSTLLAHNVVDAEISALSSGLIANVYQSTDVDGGGDNSIRTNVFELSRTIQWTQDSDKLTGDSLRDHIYGGPGSDTLEGKGGADYLDGGAGEDMAVYFHATSGVTASLLNPAINTGEAAGDTYVSIEDLYGTQFDDFLQGDNGKNVIYSGDGNDTVYGEGGDDMFWMDNTNSYGHFYGGDGNDTFWGGYSPQGQSTFAGGTGDDVYFVGNKNITVVENPGEGHDVIHFSAGVSYTLPDNFEDLYLEETSSAKVGYGNDLDNHIYGNIDSTMEGRGGNDTFDWLSGNNKLDGGTGFDTAIFYGTRADHTIAQNGSTITVSGPEGTQTLTNVEKLQFTDISVESTLAAPTYELGNFGVGAGGWSNQDQYPRELADVNGDGMADIVGFGSGGVNVSLAKGNGHFAQPTYELGNFGTNAGGWTDQNHYPRLLADVNGDGRADIVAFGAGGVNVSLATGNGHFAAPTYELGQFGTNAGGWTDQDHYPRLLGDVNGDGMADIVAFGAGGVNVSLATGNGHFAAPTYALGNFGTNAGGWTDQDHFPRMLGDVNGDGMADIVGFGSGGVNVSLATGGGHFAQPTYELAEFGVGAGGWSSYDQYPRELADMNGDGMADIVGFGNGGVSISLATGNGHFAPSTFALGNFGPGAGGWSSFDHDPRLLADVNGDHRADIVGFGNGGVNVSMELFV